NGFLAESGNAPEFAKKLKMLTAESDVRKAMRVTAREHIQSHYNVSAMVATLENLYKEACSK
ncbi:MAG: hypothetical protein ABI615_01630, partial [Chthoniobacterales bacterium]